MRTFISAVSLIFVFGLAAGAQEPEDAALVHGSITAGYRFTDISGRSQKYDQLFDLRSGFRIHDFSLYSNEEQKSRLYDSFFMTSSGIGGEPFSGGQFVMKKNHVYDLRVNYRQTHYYWDINDDQAQPSGVHGLPSNHNWATVRKIGSVNLAAYATDKLRFNFEYLRTARGGDTDSTRTLDYFGAPSTWAAAIRANPYVVHAPIDESMNRTTAGLAYSARDWSFFYRAGYQWFKESIQMFNPVSPERSINIDDALTASELLNQATWSGERKLRSPVSEFSYNGRVSERVRLRGGYIFYRYRGPRVLNGAFAGNIRTTGGATPPYSVTFQDRANVSENNHVIDQGFTVEVTSKFNFLADYRYFRYNIDSEGEFQGSTNGAAPVTGAAERQWRQGMHSLDIGLEFAPSRQLLLRPGIRLMKRDVTVLDDGVSDASASKRSKFASPILTVYYSPSRKLMLRGDVQSTTNGAPYTRISPRQDFNVRSVTRYQPTERVSFENNLHLRTTEFSATAYRNTIRSNATTMSYRLNDRLALLGGFTYDSFLATASITFVRGTAPLTAIWRDQTTSRVWLGGVEAKPTKKLAFNLSGNYIRTTGVGEISGELPTSGPLRWPLVTGTASYDLPHRSRLSVDLQRTYYIEEILRGDNFSANLLNIRWTTEF